MKIAKYKHIGSGYSYETVASEDLSTSPEFVRLSEFVDVDFPPLSNSEVIGKQLAALDLAEIDVREKFEGALNTIKRQRSELMALPHREAVNA